jgi:hypothetical protein
MKISVIVPTYNPDPNRLEQVLVALGSQRLECSAWECVIVDNASCSPVNAAWCAEVAGRPIRVAREPQVGLSHARLKGLREAKADILVLCDDDNQLNPLFLAHALEKMNGCTQVGVAGGRSLPRYTHSPPEWFTEGMAPLGCRDLGEKELCFTAADFSVQRRYPDFAPIGAGMVFRRQAVETWAASVGISGISDRKGSSLSSAGDCDMVLHALANGYDAAYWPELVLDHIIPPTRLTREYLGAISRSAYRDFIRVLELHAIRPWGPIDAGTLPLRFMKAWFQQKAYLGPAEWIRWQSSIGQFEGRARLSSIE